MGSVTDDDIEQLVDLTEDATSQTVTAAFASLPRSRRLALRLFQAFMEQDQFYVGYADEDAVETFLLAVVRRGIRFTDTFRFGQGAGENMRNVHIRSGLALARGVHFFARAVFVSSMELYRNFRDSLPDRERSQWGTADCARDLLLEACDRCPEELAPTAQSGRQRAGFVGLDVEEEDQATLLEVSCEALFDVVVDVAGLSMLGGQLLREELARTVLGQFFAAVETFPVDKKKEKEDPDEEQEDQEDPDEEQEDQELHRRSHPELLRIAIGAFPRVKRTLAMRMVHSYNEFLLSAKDQLRWLDTFQDLEPPRVETLSDVLLEINRFVVAKFRSFVGGRALVHVRGKMQTRTAFFEKMNEFVKVHFLELMVHETLVPICGLNKWEDYVPGALINKLWRDVINDVRRLQERKRKAITEAHVEELRDAEEEHARMLAEEKEFLETFMG